MLLRWSLAGLLLLTLTASAPGNPPPITVPRTNPAQGLRVGPKEQKLVVEVDDSVRQPRLVIPRDLLLAAPATEKPGRKAEAGFSTIMAGLALTMAFATGGLWLIRRRRGGIAASVALVCVGLAGTALWADIPLPKRPTKPGAVTLPANIKLSDKITVEIVEQGDSIKLVVNKGMLETRVRGRGESE